MSTDQHGPSDRISPALTRRSAITGALAATTLLATARTGTARQATPEAGDVSFLFLQACESGTATPAGDAGGVYDLTLAHVSGQTLFFSDRPDRIAGLAPTADFLEEVAAIDDPPNAALAFSPGASADVVEVAVVELTAPSLDAEAGTITYKARVIDVEQEGDAADDETMDTVDELPASFGQATLFIDGMDSHIYTLHPTYYFEGTPLSPGRSTHFPVPPGL